MPRVRAPCELAMRVGMEVEYETGIAEYGRGTVTAVDLESDTVSVSGYDWPVPLRFVIALDMLETYGAWRSEWIQLATEGMSKSGMDEEDVFFFASDNEGNLRSDFKLGKSADASVGWHAGAVAHLPRFDKTTEPG